LVSTSPTNYHGPNTPRQLWRGHNITFSLSVDWKDLAWALRSSKSYAAAPAWAFWLVASLLGMANARPPTARHYRGFACGPVHQWGQASCHPGHLYQAI
jgi:hypothetical protein